MIFLEYFFLFGLDGIYFHDDNEFGAICLLLDTVFGSLAPL